MALDKNLNYQGPCLLLFILSWSSTRVLALSVRWFSLLNRECWEILRIPCTLMNLSLGLAGFLVVFSTAGMVLQSISSLLVDIPSDMLCEHDQILYASLSLKDILISERRVDLVCSLLICVNFVYVHCLGSWMTRCWCVKNSWLC